MLKCLPQPAHRANYESRKMPPYLPRHNQIGALSFVLVFASSFTIGIVAIAHDEYYPPLLLLSYALLSHIDTAFAMTNEVVMIIIVQNTFYCLLLIVYTLLVASISVYFELLSSDTIIDSPYFLGFLFTLASLVNAFWGFTSASGSSSIEQFQLINSAGIALITSIIGLLCRLFLSVVSEFFAQNDSAAPKKSNPTDVSAQKYTRDTPPQIAKYPSKDNIISDGEESVILANSKQNQSGRLNIIMNSVRSTLIFCLICTLLLAFMLKYWMHALISKAFYCIRGLTR